MAKKPMQIVEFEHRLDQSDQLTKRLLEAIEGNPKIGVKGLAPLVDSFTTKLDTVMTDVSDLKRWKKDTEDSAGMVSIKWSVLFQRFLAVVGGIGTLAAAAIGVTKIIDWLKAQGIIALIEL